MTLVNQNTRKIVLVYLLLLVLSCIAALAINNGFYFSETNESIELKLIPIEEYAITQQDLKNYSSIGKASRVNREENSITYEHKSLENLSEEIKDLTSENFSTQITTQSESVTIDRIIQTLISAFFILNTALVLFVTYYLYRDLKSKIRYRLLVSYFFIYTIGILATYIIHFGLLSIISRIYQVKIFDIYSLILINIWAIFVFTTCVIKYKYKTLKEFAHDFQVENIRIIRFTVKALPLLFAPVLFGMGNNFVIPAIVITVGLINYLLMNYLLSFIINRVFNRIEIHDKVVAEQKKTVVVKPASSEKKFQKSKATRRKK